MTRRTRTLARPFSDFLHYEKPPEGVTHADSRSGGVASIMVDYIGRHAREHRDVSVELYGHSMGAMVANEILREINEGRVTDPIFSRLVYMAAACSMRDFIDTGGRYLSERKREYRQGRAPQCHFYNLCLHPEAEHKEIYKLHLNLAVSGSLLIWIDNYYQKPEAFLDRTLGSYQNAIIARRFLPRGTNCTYKAFGYAFGERKDIYGPQKHGDVDGFRFWEDEYLEARDAPADDGEIGYKHLRIPEPPKGTILE